MRYLACFIIIVFGISCQTRKGSQGESFTSNVDQVAADIINDSEQLTFFDNPGDPLTPAFEMLPAGSNKPAGWLFDIMKSDLGKGMVGALDELYPGITKDDLYHTARRGGMDDVPEMGDIVLTGAEWETSIMWWNAETTGNWWDGFVRHAFLTGNKEAIEQSHKIVENLLDSQDEDGYIGIYKENLRYRHEGSNGELWAQTTAFRMLLAYYELTGNEKVLEAVEKAMAVTMENYSNTGRNPFYLKNAFGGVTHGLMMTDVCETLHRITGNTIYQDYATWLYRSFSTYSINRAFNDVRYPFLVQKDSLFVGHGAHTYEHLRSILNAWYHTGYPELEKAYQNAMYKLEFCLLPSGAGHGQEWIAKMIADPTYTHTEFCTMLELRNFLGSAAQKTGDTRYADHAEKLTFNGIMGFRNSAGTALTYGKGDNCYVLDGHKHGEHDMHEDPRYKYSPTHSDPAVCCVPNYTRNFSYYLDYMWLRSGDGLAAVLYGPCSLTTTFNGVKVSVEQTENYPMSEMLRFKISTSEPSTFALYFRKPGWVKKMEINAGNTEETYENGFYRIEKEWTGGDEVLISFKYDVQPREFRNGEIYFQRGPLVYSYPIPHEEKSIKNYELKGFMDYYCFPTDNSYEGLSISADYLSEFQYDFQGWAGQGNSWYQPEPFISVNITDKNGNPSEKKLVPMGNTVLRRVTFPVTDK